VAQNRLFGRAFDGMIKGNEHGVGADPDRPKVTYRLCWRQMRSIVIGAIAAVGLVVASAEPTLSAPANALGLQGSGQN
jgi:hypothetical protein